VRAHDSYQQAVKAVLAHSNKRKSKTRAKLFQELETGFATDKKLLFGSFRKRIFPAPPPLPATVITDRGEIRNPRAIRESWKERFYIKPEERGDAEDQTFREDIRSKVRGMRKEIEPGWDERKIYFSLRQTESFITDISNGKQAGLDEILNEMIKKSLTQAQAGAKRPHESPVHSGTDR
jgi:hypothetical protein